MKIRFEPFTLDLVIRQLLRAGEEIRLSPKAFELLRILVAERPAVLSKTALQERLWPETFVSEANLANLIAEVRQALGDPARAPRFIRTAHGFGYAFCADATIVEGGRHTTNSRPRCWLEWGLRRFPLMEGTHVIGRDEDADVHLDHTTVSRRHARIIVDARGARLEDLGSKNGTFVAEARLTAPVALVDGTAVRVGSVRLNFRARDPIGSTKTLTRSLL
ncbi:MAG: winged helix-turn-helix domain-containing protein [Acidobacteria bacterium]|nr:winged helix-turn-helix domain-containing protein [Acidobacteriota bacterium]